MEQISKENFEIRVCCNCDLSVCVGSSVAGCLIKGERGRKMRQVFDLLQKYKVVEFSDSKKNPPAETVKMLSFLAGAKLIKKTEVGFQSL